MKRKKRIRHEGPLMSQLWALYEEEHGGCDQNTCDMAVAYRLGHIRWAVQLFAWSGAASDEFMELFRQLPKVFKTRAEKERKALCNEEYIECPHCNAILWLPEETNYYCDSCANDIPKPIKIEVLPISRWTKVNKIAIHLLEPSEHELERAKEDAHAKNFELICVYRKEVKVGAS